jgi:hypothetical protein
VKTEVWEIMCNERFQGTWASTARHLKYSLKIY